MYNDFKIFIHFHFDGIFTNTNGTENLFYCVVRPQIVILIALCVRKIKIQNRMIPDNNGIYDSIRRKKPKLQIR